MKHNHHTIPISMLGIDSQENIIRIDAQDHEQLHREQNLPYNVIRRFREKTNWILVPNDYLFDMKKDLYLQYFWDAKTEVGKQEYSLGRQVLKYKAVNNDSDRVLESNLLGLVEQLVESQREFVGRILR